MSPEQVQGKDADARSDIFSFGCVLLEALTGQCAFAGDTAADLISAILTQDPLADASLTPLPPALAIIIRHCLEKSPEDRFQSARDLAFALEASCGGSAAKIAVKATLAVESTPVEAAAGTGGARMRRLAWSVAAVLALVLVSVTSLHFREKPPAPALPVRFQIAPPENTTLGCCEMLSPDGRKLAFTAGDRLWVHFLESGETRNLTLATDSPFWSPDSRFIAYRDSGKVKKIESAGGPPQVLADWPASIPQGGAWNRDDVIVFGTNVGLFRVSASGGVPAPVTTVDPAGQDTFLGPSFLPDGRHFFYCRFVEGGIYLGSVDAKPEQQSSKPLIGSFWQPQYVPPPRQPPGTCFSCAKARSWHSPSITVVWN